MAISWSGATAQKLAPNNVSGLVVYTLISLAIFVNFPRILKLKTAPDDFPIQFFCISFTLSGHLSNFSNPSSKSSEKSEIFKNH